MGCFSGKHGKGWPPKSTQVSEGKKKPERKTLEPFPKKKSLSNVLEIRCSFWGRLRRPQKRTRVCFFGGEAAEKTHILFCARYLGTCAKQPGEFTG